jgi:hypothetical protein
VIKPLPAYQEGDQQSGDLQLFGTVIVMSEFNFTAGIQFMYALTQAAL